MTFSPPISLPVAVIGATSPLGQHLVARLAAHPWFQLIAVADQHSSRGASSLPYGQVVDWQMAGDELPAVVAALPLLPCHPAAFPGVKLVFSALTTPDEGKIEAACAEAGMAVFSNASK